LAQEAVKWFQLTLDEVEKTLQSDVDHGLREQEISRRLLRHGKNILAESKKKTLWNMFIGQFKDFIVLVLLAAAVISGFVGETTDTILILSILFLNAILGMLQENKANRALELLQKMSLPDTEVLRNGIRMQVSSEELVPGDVVILREGDFVPADMRLVEAVNLRVDESGLTGESIPVEKTAQKIDEDVPLPDRINMVFSGTVVTYGRGRGFVTATAMDREIGRVAKMIEQEKDVVTPLQKRLAALGKLLGTVTMFLCGAIFFLGWLRGEPVAEMFMTAVSLAVAAVPGGLLTIFTIVLALGVYRMSRFNAIVRRLPSVETLGCSTYICTDKTGTLTQNRMGVQVFLTAEEVVNGFQPAGLDSEKALLDIFVLCNDASVDGERRFGDPTELALVDFAAKKGIAVDELRKAYPRLKEIPFDSKRKIMSTVHRMGESEHLLVKGAPDFLLARCSRIPRNGVEVPLGEKEYLQVSKRIEQMAEEGLRVLAFAWKDLVHHESFNEETEANLVFAGLVGLIDPPRPKVKKALQDAKSAGMRTIMVTGDNPVTARSIARSLGMLENDGEVVTGVELEKLTDQELREKIDKVRVFARVWPEQKLKIVEALQERKEIVAVTGDGVNDAPALKRADIGVAMGSGTDVAKEVADVVLLDDNYATIVKAIEEGRVIFDNIRKFVVYLLSCNLGEVFSIFFPILFGFTRPLIPVQILLVNLVTDGLPALAMGVDPPEPGVMKRPPRNPGEEIITPFYLKVIFFISSFITLAVVAAFLLGLRRGGVETGRTMAFFTLAISELWRAYSTRSEVRNFWRIDPRTNLPLIGACLLSALIVISTILIEPLRVVFGNTKLDTTEWMVVCVLSLVPFAANELWKYVKRVMSG